MQAPHLHSIHGQNLWLSNERGIYWEEEKALILSDLHFGKTGHFRKSGIPVPQHVYKHDLQRLVGLIQYFQPVKLIVVGDLFHSRENKELELFLKWRNDFPALDIELVMGNHDILHKRWYQQASINVIPESLRINSFDFRHDLVLRPNPAPPAGITPMALSGDSASMSLTETVIETSPSYLFSGHIHPGIAIRGLGKQSLRFPCFYFTEYYCVLPAFSRFTGTFLVDPAPGEQVFAIVDNRLMAMHNLQ